MLVKLITNQIDLLLSLTLGTLFHQSIDIVACLVRICPLFKYQGEFKLLFSERKNLSHLNIIVKFNGVRDLACTVRLFIVFQDLIEVRVQSLRDLFVLALVLVLQAEFKNLARSVIVEIEKSVVRPQGVEDDLECLDEEIDPRSDSALLLDPFKVAVSHQEKVIC